MPDPERPKSQWIQIARYSQLAVALPAATAIGYALGWLADKWLGTSWLYLLGLILGIVAGFVELIRTVTARE